MQLASVLKVTQDEPCLAHFIVFLKLSHLTPKYSENFRGDRRKQIKMKRKRKFMVLQKILGETQGQA